MSGNDSRSKTTPVLLLKTKSTPNDGYQEQLSLHKNGSSFQPIFVPVLEHQFLEDGLIVVRNLLRNKEIRKSAGSKYGGMIFTSQRAVEAFAKLVEEGKGAYSQSPLQALRILIRRSIGDGDWPHLQDVPIYTVGPATSRALKSIPQSPPLQIFGAETGNGAALAHYMLNHYGKWYRDQEIKPPLLFLVGEQRRDIIPKTLMDPELNTNRRIQVDELVVYGTGVMESFEQDFTQVLQETDTNQTRWLVVFSPTGCEAMLRALNMLDFETGRVKTPNAVDGRATYIATIGPTTRDFLKNSFGFEPDVCAEKPSPEGVEDGIRNFAKYER